MKTTQIPLFVVGTKSIKMPLDLIEGKSIFIYIFLGKGSVSSSVRLFDADFTNVNNSF